MSRTYRNSRSLKRMIRHPRYKSALRAMHDEYRIRNKALPPTEYEDLPVAAWREIKNRFGVLKHSKKRSHYIKNGRIMENLDLLGTELPIAEDLMLPDNMTVRRQKEFDNGYTVSVIRNNMSCGHKQGRFEIGLFGPDGDMTSVEGITYDGDTVKGWLTIDDVLDIFKKVAAL